MVAEWDGGCVCEWVRKYWNWTGEWTYHQSHVFGMRAVDVDETSGELEKFPPYLVDGDAERLQAATPQLHWSVTARSPTVAANSRAYAHHGISMLRSETCNALWSAPSAAVAPIASVLQHRAQPKPRCPAIDPGPTTCHLDRPDPIYLHVEFVQNPTPDWIRPTSVRLQWRPLPSCANRPTPSAGRSVTRRGDAGSKTSTPNYPLDLHLDSYSKKDHVYWLYIYYYINHILFIAIIHW